MKSPDLRMTYVGGPTAMLEVGTLRLLTDPTFDPPGGEYHAASYVLRKTQGPVARRFPITAAVPFMGAARVTAVGPRHLTFTASEGVTAARAFGSATIVPVHFEGWEHFSESRDQSFVWFEKLGWKKGWDWGNPPTFGGVCSGEGEIFRF